MIKKYLIERRSWIFLVIFLQLLTVFIAMLDTQIELKPILYITFLSFIIFLIFLIIRYNTETKFYKSLEERENNLDLTSVASPARPLEHIIDQSIRDQTRLLKKEASLHLFNLEQEKDELLSWIHEVKTPLTAMQLMIDRIEDETLKSQLKVEWLRVHYLLDHQLHQKRLLFIENDLYIEKVEIKPIIFQEIKTLQSWCMQKGIGFDIELKATEVYSDAKWLAFIIRQLLTNAVKYSHESDIMMGSRIKEEHCVLVIQDFGRGIDAKDLPRIFDKGFTSTTNHYDNAATGMGLYLVQKIARPLMVHIDVQSKPEEGTTFTLTFPKSNNFSNIRGM
ncbi:sensor histidine kinase [Chengkuizengella axinellae]|uniref:histidine kinase n=1 Tax=Chengkuizengella axinellae TaxID=3064388 RepID=A0ABT9J315_9BACL|nr:sensor histidine kinase [Chengkuizengella sp. 2205SS18-9]MDP5276016.1 sensor histidine kinase [Chengkuizengella sp. 2205SS18-9]